MTETALPNTTRLRGGRLCLEFKNHRRGIFNNPLEFPFEPGDYAIVEADRGEDAGRVNSLLPPADDDEMNSQFKVLRLANPEDMLRIERHRIWEAEALETCRSRIQKYNLPMRLIDAEYRYDELKLTFYFTAEGRVDFRDLVRDLAGTFRMRIELRQIGTRDQTKRWEGHGICGYRLCCVNFLESFKPITTQMAKEQNLILNPSKLSGLCGKLKCCLAFELDEQTLRALSCVRDTAEFASLEDTVEEVGENN
ncbi:MAG: hypothetical protein FJY65_01335 [Calditrichaeota bacterium]|nr:hypothetical protein [Calditrichota bacterium]